MVAQTAATKYSHCNQYVLVLHCYMHISLLNTFFVVTVMIITMTTAIITKV